LRVPPTRIGERHQEAPAGRHPAGKSELGRLPEQED
jgi:hypothetical protein